MKKTSRGSFEVLCYHQVGAENSFDGLTLSEKLFTNQMHFIQKNCHPLSLSDLVQTLRNGKKIPSHSVAVTFDDGYLDTFKVALPILKRFKVPATVFVTTGFVDRKVPMYKNAPALTWSMIRTMQRQGIEIGCHTLTHPRLTQCNTAEINRQIIESKKRIEEVLGQPIRFFAYPYGGVNSFNKTIQASVRKAGFLAALTTVPGSNNHKTPLYGLRRMSPSENHLRSIISELVWTASTKRNTFKKVKISGITPAMMKIWPAPNKPLKKKLLPDSPFYWPIGRPVDS